MTAILIPEETPEENARRFCFAVGWHDEGDTRVMFRNGGVVNLPELLSGYAEQVMKERDAYKKLALEMAVIDIGPFILTKGVDAGSSLSGSSPCGDPQ